jgi:hypothetical protein
MNRQILPDRKARKMPLAASPGAQKAQHGEPTKFNLVR